MTDVQRALEKLTFKLRVTGDGKYIGLCPELNLETPEEWGMDDAMAIVTAAAWRALEVAHGLRASGPDMESLSYWQSLDHLSSAP